MVYRGFGDFSITLYVYKNTPPMHPAYPPKTIPCAIPKKIHREFLSFFWGVFWWLSDIFGKGNKDFCLKLSLKLTRF